MNKDTIRCPECSEPIKLIEYGTYTTHSIVYVDGETEVVEENRDQGDIMKIDCKCRNCNKYYEYDYVNDEVVRKRR